MSFHDAFENRIFSLKNSINTLQHYPSLIISSSHKPATKKNMCMRKECTKSINYLSFFVLHHYFNSHNPSNDDVVGCFNSKTNEHDYNKTSDCKIPL